MMKRLIFLVAASAMVTACSKPAAVTKQQVETSPVGTYIGTFESKDVDEAKLEDVEITLNEGGRATWKLLDDPDRVFQFGWEQKENQIIIKNPSIASTLIYKKLIFMKINTVLMRIFL